jgi:hypothetical protein
VRYWLWVGERGKVRSGEREGMREIITFMGELGWYWYVGNLHVNGGLCVKDAVSRCSYTRRIRRLERCTQL